MEIKNLTLLKPVTCIETDIISAAAKKLKKNRLRHLYVIDKKKKLLGVFAGQDVIYSILAVGKDYRKMNVKECMNTKIVSFSNEDPVIKAIGFMSSTNILSVPVVGNGILVGVLSYKDAMTALLKAKKEQLQQQNKRDRNAGT